MRVIATVAGMRVWWHPPGVSVAGFVVAMSAASSARAQAIVATPADPAPLAAPASDPRYTQLPPITFRAINTNETAAVRVYRDDGSLDPTALDTLSHVLRDVRNGHTHPVVPRSVQLLVRIATHFHAATIEVISGFRSGRDAEGHRIRHEGYHSVGSAIDFRLPETNMVEVAAYARTFAHVGVGWYPTSGFVHLDSREQTFYWENRSGPGHRGWDRPLDREGVAERDANWSNVDDAPWDAPGPAAHLVLHPRTAAGAHPPRHARREHHHVRAHGHPPLHVFAGTDVAASQPTP